MSEISGLESVEDAGDDGQTPGSKQSSRSNHQRLLAIEIMILLVRTG